MPTDTPSGAGVSRRSLLLRTAAVATATGAAVAVGGVAVGAGRERRARAEALDQAEWLRGQETMPFHGFRQAGIEMQPQAHQSIVGLTLRAGTDREGIRRLLTLLSDDAARLTAGTHALADSEPELAEIPARLTVTFGFGPALVRAVAPDAVPDWLHPLPAFSRDRLEDRYSGGDLCLQIAADDPLTVAHAQRMLLKDARSFAELKWVQAGFRRSYGSEPPGQTQRNLFGQLDGTVNPAPGTDDFASVVWRGQAENPAWLDGGTGFVIRRIDMRLDAWDRVDRPGREASIGRNIATGAPLTGTAEHDEPDFTAKTPHGFPVIGEFSHLRRARSDDPRQRMFRRTYNYDEPPSGEELSRSGLLFTAFQYDVAKQFTPIQQRLDELDLLNEWIEHRGSAVFAIPPGASEGGFVGETLFTGR